MYFHWTVGLKCVLDHVLITIEITGSRSWSLSRSIHDILTAPGLLGEQGVNRSLGTPGSDAVDN